MGTWLQREMRVRVAAQWAARTASVPLDPFSPAWGSDRPSSERVAMLFLAYREGANKTPGKRKLDMKNFLREEGTKTVTSPLTGEKVKLKTLTGPKYQEDPKSQDLLNKLFKEWRDKNKAKGDEAPKEEAPAQEAPPVEAPEVKAPPVEAPDVRAVPGDAAPAKKEAPAQEPSEQDMQEAYDPYVNTRDQAPPKKKAPAAPSQDAPAAPSQDKAPEPDLDNAPAPSQDAPQPAGTAPPSAPEAPEPDLDKELAKDLEPLLEQGASASSLVEFFRNREKALREWAGEEPDDKNKDKDKNKVELGLKRVSQEARKLLEKHKLSGTQADTLTQFSKAQHEARQQARAPIEDVKKRHGLQDSDEKALNRVRDTVQKKYQAALSKYNKDKRQYDTEKAEADKATEEATNQRDTLKSEHEKAGGSQGEFDSAYTFAQRHNKRQQVQMSKWEKARDKAEEEGTEPPPKPEPVDAHVEWLKDHKAKWEAQPEATRGEYQPPMVSREMFEKIQKAPAIPKQPEPLGDPPQPPTAKDIRQEINDSDPELKDTLKDVPDADFDAMVKPDDFKSVAEMKAEFLDNTDDPGLKQRVMEMDPDEFEELLAALNPYKHGKKGSLTERTIRLAYARPELREHLLWAITASYKGG